MPFAGGALGDAIRRAWRRQVIPVFTSRDLRRTWKTLAGKAASPLPAASPLWMGPQDGPYLELIAKRFSATGPSRRTGAPCIFGRYQGCCGHGMGERMA